MKTAPLRVLVVEDDAGDARLLQLMLRQVAPDQFELTHVARLADAVRELAKGATDIILSDMDLPDSRGLATFAQLQSQAPRTPIVVLSGLDDEALGAKAVQLGAQDYLIKGQANGPWIARSLRHALERHKRQQEQLGGERTSRADVLAFLGAKGGVGATTVAVNVAAALARQKKRVVLVELQPTYGTLALLLRRSPPPANLRHVLDLPPGRLNEQEVRTRFTQATGDLRVLFGPQKAEEFKPIDAGQAAALVEELRGLADWIILDLPCEPSPANESALRKCRFVGLIVEREAVCMAAGRMQLDLLRSWDVTAGQVGAVIVHRAAIALPMKWTDVRAQLGCEVVGVVPHAVDACLMAQQACTPLVVLQPQNAAALALTELAGRMSANPVPVMKVS